MQKKQKEQTSTVKVQGKPQWSLTLKEAVSNPLILLPSITACRNLQSLNTCHGEREGNGARDTFKEGDHLRVNENIKEGDHLRVNENIKEKFSHGNKTTKSREKSTCHNHMPREECGRLGLSS